jgi:hypothetical protein
MRLGTGQSSATLVTCIRGEYGWIAHTPAALQWLAGKLGRKRGDQAVAVAQIGQLLPQRSLQ